MGKNNEKNEASIRRHLIPPRVTGDFGGRRKTYERRLKRTFIDHSDRRDIDDRRSGYDRRGITIDHNAQRTSGNRKNDQNDKENDK